MAEFLDVQVQGTETSEIVREGEDVIQFPYPVVDRILFHGVDQIHVAGGRAKLFIFSQFLHMAGTDDGEIQVLYQDRILKNGIACLQHLTDGTFFHLDLVQIFFPGVAAVEKFLNLLE